MIELTLPWPPRALNPNERLHHMALARAKKAYRRDCYYQALEQGAKAMNGPVDVQITFFPPDARKRDDDNKVSAFKAGRDGVADAIKVNDNNWRVHYFFSDQLGGMVKLKIQETL